MTIDTSLNQMTISPKVQFYRQFTLHISCPHFYRQRLAVYLHNSVSATTSFLASPILHAPTTYPSHLGELMMKENSKTNSTTTPSLMPIF